jgi:hypothetical protein
VYVREDQLVDGVNEWIGTLVDPENLDQTVAAMVGAQEEFDPAEAAERMFRQRIEAANATMARLQWALEAGWIQRRWQVIQRCGR